MSQLSMITDTLLRTFGMPLGLLIVVLLMKYGIKSQKKEESD